MRRRRDFDDLAPETENKKPQERGKSVGRKQVDRTNQPIQYTPYEPKRNYKSKYQEFMAAEWRYSRTEINITHETIVPKLPNKPKTEPNDAAYHNHQLECDERVDALYKELNDFTLEFKQKQRDMYDEQNGKGIMWREMKEHFDEQKIYLAQKREIMKMRENADLEIQDLVREMQKLTK